MKKYLIPRGFDIKIAIHSAQTLSEGTKRERQNVDNLPEQYEEILGAWSTHHCVCTKRDEPIRDKTSPPTGFRLNVYLEWKWV